VKNGSAQPPDFAYDAFASHATDPDGALVRRVEAVLEAFHRRRGLPQKYVRELQVCLDGRDFVFPRRHGESIVAIEPIVRAYQQKSRSLLVLSGSLSLNHPWINHEIQWWAKERPDGPVYFALTHGAEYEPADSDSFMPKALRDRGGPDNPVYFDLRGFYRERDVQSLFGRRLGYSGHEAQLRSEAAGWPSVRPFNEELTKLAALLVSDATGASISVSELVTAYGEVERRDRLWRRIKSTAVLLSVSLLLGVLIWTALTEQRRQRLTDWAQEATLLSASLGPGLLDALAYASSAVRDGDDPSAIQVLYDILFQVIPVDQAIHPLFSKGSPKQIQAATVVGHDAWLASGGRGGTVYLNDTSNGAPVAELPLKCGRIRAIVPLPGGGLIAIASDRGLRFVSISLTTAGPQLRDAGTLLGRTRVTALATDDNGTLYASEHNGRLWRVDPEASSQGQTPPYRTVSLGIIRDPRDATVDIPSSVSGMAVRGMNLFVAGPDGVLTVFDISNAPALPHIFHQIIHPAPIHAMDVARDGSTIAVADAAGDLYLYNADLTEPRRAELRVPNPASVNQHIDGKWASASADTSEVVGIAFDLSGNVVAATGHDRTIKFFLTRDLHLIGIDVHSADTRGVVFASEHAAFTFGDDGIINKVDPLSVKPGIRVGEVDAFAVASETAQIAYWVTSLKRTTKVFVIQPDMAQPGIQVGEFVGSGGDGIAFGPRGILVQNSSVFVREYPLVPEGKLTCPKGGLENPSDSGNLRLIRGTRADQAATITRPASDGPSQLRLWSVVNCSTQWRHDYDGRPEQASIGAGVIRHHREQIGGAAVCSPSRQTCCRGQLLLRALCHRRGS
jgi:hypothetical protein